jgi:oligopeptide transport system ATP-binding protein
VEIAEAEELFDFPLHPYTHSLISAIPIPDPQLEKNKVLYTYDPSIHDYSEDKPSLQEVSPGHFVFGNAKEIEEYKAIRAKGEKLKSITILTPEEAEARRLQAEKGEDSIPEGEYILNAPVHDTGSMWYSVLSFFLPPVGLIAAFAFRKRNYIRNFKACRKGALIGLGVLAAIVAIFGIGLILAML